MKARLLYSDPGGCFKAGDIGTVLENNFDKYDYKIDLPAGISDEVFGKERAFYFFAHEVEIIPGTINLRGNRMKKYRKKPVVIEAVQYSGSNDNEIDKFVGPIAAWVEDDLVVNTLEGPLRVSPGDYIIKGVKGEFYPCKPDIFEMTYTEVQS